MNTPIAGKHLEQLRQQTAMAKFGELALQCDDLDEILTEACRLVGQALGTDLAKVMELQADGETLLVRAGVGWKPGVVGEVTLKATSDSSEGHALKTGEPMISPDIEHETRFKYPAFLTENGVKAVANVVIIGGLDQQPFGILQIDSREPRQFNDDDTNFLRGYANLLAAAVSRLRTMEQGRAGEDRLQFALESGELGSWELDLASGSATRNQRYDQIFGYTGPPPVWTYDILLEHVLQEDREHVGSTFRHAVENGTKWRFECRIRRASDGEVRWIESQGRPAGTRGNAPPTHLLGILADVTDRRMAQEALLRLNEALEARVAARTSELVEANEKLRTEAAGREQVEEALRQSHKMDAVGQLTGGLAHDFNNLLAGISGSLEQLRLRAAQGRTADFGRYIDAGLVSANRATALTQRLLAFSRRQTLDPKPIAVNELVSGMEDLLRQTLGPAIDLETRFQPTIWPVFCDRNQLENALLNLVLNARDSMPGGGRVLIETFGSGRGGPHGAASEAPPGEHVALSVTDAGVGMAPSVAARAFDPFFTTKPLGHGTGLGLSMIYGFVQQSGGRVVLRSTEGQGTAVTIYLPRHSGTVEAEPQHGMQLLEPAYDSSVVLVVEDEPAVRMIIVDLLTDQGHTALEAIDGRAGLDIMESDARIDLLVTDVGLPGGMNGRQLADAARQRRPGLKVLFVTGYADGVAVGNGQLDPGMQVMTKPFRLDALAARVRDMIDA